MTQHSDDEHPVGNIPERPSAPSGGRTRVVLALAVVGLVAAIIGALGPADRVRTTYSWPPEVLPTETPALLWYTPLLLIRHEPEAISARLPCSLAPPLPDAQRPLTVLATARVPDRNRGLAISSARDRLVVTVGDLVLARLDATTDSTVGEDCAYRLRIADRRWLIDGGPDDATLEGGLETMPVVSGLFSALDLRSEAAPSIDVTTQAHATLLTLRQTVAWAVAILCSVAALLLVAFQRVPRPWAVTRGAARAAVTHAHPTDAVVAVVLTGWWVLSPAFWDDGMVIATSRTFSASGGLSNYYSAFGVNLPLDVWLEWMQHWLTDASSALLVFRIPSLVCLAATWVVCRWVLARVLRSSGADDRIALWALASAFLLGALAWGMTLRPEPVTALLVTGVLACTVRFLDRETTAPLVVAAVLVPLALTVHQAGVVALAPLIVAVPRLFRWARARWIVATTVITSSLALLVVLAFVGSDVDQRRADARTFKSVVWSEDTWHDESLRYARLADVWFATPVRRAAVALIILAVLAFVLRRRRGGRPLLDFPGAALTVGLVLLIATPYKWPWHFGALLGLAAVAVAAEAARLHDEARRSKGLQALPLLAICAATVAAAWSWAGRSPWNALDLRTLDWSPGLNELDFATALPLLVLGASAIAVFAFGRRSLMHRVPWRVAALTAPLLAVPLIVFTTGVFVVDSAKTESWTLAKQNLRTLRGDLECGLADEMLVVAPQSLRPLVAAGEIDVRSAPAWVSPTPADNVPRFVLGPIADGTTSTPWFTLSDDRRIGLFVAGKPGESDRLELEWGRRQEGGIASIGSEEVLARFESQPESTTVPWAFLSAAELPPPESRSNVVRVVLQGVTPPGGIASGAVVAVTAPVSYENEALTGALSRATQSLVIPNVLTYFPCVQQPLLDDGVVDVPGTIITEFDSIHWLRSWGGSPFQGLLDLYTLRRESVADSKDPPPGISVFAIDEIPGAVRAPPDKATVSS